MYTPSMQFRKDQGFGPFHRLAWLLTSMASIVAGLCLLPADCDAAEWSVGVAKLSITPQSPMPMAGYASRGAAHAEGTLDELWVKTLILEDEHGTQAAVITLDVCGIDRDLAQQAVASVSSATGIDKERILISVSHTHSGPVIASNLRPMHYAIFGPSDRQAVDAYSQELVQRTVRCALTAFNDRRPSQLAHATGQATFAVNRRNNPENEVPKLREAGQLRGPVDHDVPVLSVKQDGKLVAVLFGYACHCTTLSGMLWSGDYAGFAQQELEAAQPGSIAMFWAGCGGDQNPIPRRSVELAKDYGKQLAAAVQSALVGPLTPITPQLATSYQEIDLPFGSLPGTSQLQADALSDNVYTAARAQHLLKQIDDGTPLSATYPYPIACWKLGRQVELISLGGEVVVDYALAIKSANHSPAEPWVMAYAHDVMAYIPSRRVLAEGGYEGGGAMVYYGLPAAWAPEIERLILSEVERAAGSHAAMIQAC